MNIKRFEDLEIWIEARELCKVVYEITSRFCKRFLSKSDRTVDQMVQAARSGKQNIVEGNMASGTSRRTELKLVGIARASLEELLQDFEDYLRQHKLPIWGKDDPRAKAIRAMAYGPRKAYGPYAANVEKGTAEVPANTIICLIHQTNYLLDHQLRQLDRRFLEEGGITERLYRMRQQRR